MGGLSFLSNRGYGGLQYLHYDPHLGRFLSPFGGKISTGSSLIRLTLDSTIPGVGIKKGMHMPEMIR